MCVVLLLFRPEVWRSVSVFFRLHINVYHMTLVCFGLKILILKERKNLYPSVFHTIVGFSFLFGATFTLSFLKVACVHCFCWPRKTNSISFVYSVVGLAHGVVCRSTGHCWKHDSEVAWRKCLYCRLFCVYDNDGDSWSVEVSAAMPWGPVLIGAHSGCILWVHFA